MDSGIVTSVSYDTPCSGVPSMPTVDGSVVIEDYYDGVGLIPEGMEDSGIQDQPPVDNVDGALDPTVDNPGDQADNN